jgi:hypothetical protein
MFCAYCGQQIPEDAAFCNQCGKPVKASTSSANEFAEYDIYQETQTSGDIRVENSDTGPLLSADTPVNFIAPVPTPMPTPAPQTPLPLSPLQRFLVRNFQQNTAGNALFGVTAGCMVASIVGITVSWLILTIVHAFTPAIPSTSGNSQETLYYILGIYPLYAPFRDALELFLAIQGIGLHGLYGTTAYAFNSPLHGLLLVPALFLTLGGYIAASTDLRNQRQRSLVRGAAIALPYTAILLIISWQVNGYIPASVNASTPTQNMLTVDTGSLLFFGLLWGAIFGLLGASLKLARGQWRHLLHQYLRTNKRPQIAGMIAGACWASVLGPGLSLITIYGILAYTAVSIPLLSRNLCTGGNWQALVTWGVSQGPLHAVDLFFFSLGASIISHTSTVAAASQSCFYPDIAQAPLALHEQNRQLATWIYVLPLIPALSLFIGGYISTKISRTQKAGPRAISGALIAVPFTLLMLFLTFVSTITMTISSTAPESATSTVQSMGASPADLLLWALLNGAFFGALGGIFQGSIAEKWSRSLLAFLIAVVEFLAKPVYLLLAKLSGQTVSSLHTSTRSLLYSTLFCALLLAIATGVIDVLLIASNQTIMVQLNQQIRNVVSVLLVTIPGLFLFCTFAIALRDPIENGQQPFPEGRNKQFIDR